MPARRKASCTSAGSVVLSPSTSPPSNPADADGRRSANAASAKRRTRAGHAGAGGSSGTTRVADALAGHVHALARQARGRVEDTRVAEAEGTLEPRVDGETLALGERRWRTVQADQDPPRANHAVDPLDVERQPRAVGRPDDRLGGEPCLDARRERQREQADVLRRQRRRRRAQRAEHRDRGEQRDERVHGLAEHEHQHAGGERRREHRHAARGGIHGASAMPAAKATASGASGSASRLVLPEGGLTAC